MTWDASRKNALSAAVLTKKYSGRKHSLNAAMNSVFCKVGEDEIKRVGI